MLNITLIDVKNICWGLCRNRKTESRIKIGFIYFIDKIIKELQCNKLIFIGEGKSKNRWQSFKKTQKKQQSNIKELFYQVFNDVIDTYIPYLINKYKDKCDISMFTNQNCEADDVIGILTLYYRNINNTSIISNDKDFYQLVNTNVNVYGFDNKLKLVNTIEESTEWNKTFQSILQKKTNDKQYITFPKKRKKISILCDPMIYPEKLWVEILTYI